MSLCHSSPGRAHSKRRAGFFTALRRLAGGGALRGSCACANTRRTLEGLTRTPEKRHSHEVRRFQPGLSCARRTATNSAWSCPVSVDTYPLGTSAAVRPCELDDLAGYSAG